MGKLRKPQVAATCVVVALGVALFVHDRAIVDAEADALYHSLSPGSPISRFKAPHTRRLRIDFVYTVDSAEAHCLDLAVSRDTLQRLGPALLTKRLPSRDSLEREIETLRSKVRDCYVMKWTLQDLTPYRRTIRVHYREGHIVRVERPVLWDAPEQRVSGALALRQIERTAHLPSQPSRDFPARNQENF